MPGGKQMLPFLPMPPLPMMPGCFPGMPMPPLPPMMPPAAWQQAFPQQQKAADAPAQVPAPAPAAAPAEDADGGAGGAADEDVEVEPELEQLFDKVAAMERQATAAQVWAGGHVVARATCMRPLSPPPLAHLH